MTQATHVRAGAAAPQDLIRLGEIERQVVVPDIEEDETAGPDRPDRPGRVMEVNGMDETVLKLAPKRGARSKAPHLVAMSASSIAGSGSIASSRCWGGARWRVFTRQNTWACTGPALKVMDADLVQKQPGLRKQFWAEALAAANLVHPHVVTIHNLGMPKGSISSRWNMYPAVRRCAEILVRQGPLEPAGAAADLARQIVLALGAAHNSGLVDRDIKPANVLMTPDGKAKLGDFGLVRRVEILALGRALGRNSQLHGS